jgi:cytochrome b subunit of formate dehydrogenase
MLDRSVHANGSLHEIEFSNGPLLEPGQSVCLYCHDEPVFRDPIGLTLNPATAERTFDRCDVCHTGQIPVNTEFALRHVAARLAPARTSLEVAQTCAVCHSDPAVTAKAELPDAVASYMRSFHGKAALLGDETTASCVSCHVRAGENAHLMLGHDDPGSAVYPTNVANSCRSLACHPGADPRIGSMAVHLDLPTSGATLEFLLALAFIAITAISFLPTALLVVLELVGISLGRWGDHHEKREHVTAQLMARPDGRRKLTRFRWPQRVQHWLLALSFTVLVVTGFPMKFADQVWAGIVIDAFGGLHISRLTHHWAGILLCVGLVGHLLLAGWSIVRSARVLRPDGRRTGYWSATLGLPMVMSLTDLKLTLAQFAFLLRLRKERPTFGRFSPTEKFEYFGVLWGSSLLGLTGMLLWGEQIASQLLEGRVLNVASIVHTYEAFLALIHVGILHIYNVMFAPHVFPLSPAMITGRTPTAKLAEEHGAFVSQAARELGIAEGSDDGE